MILTEEQKAEVAAHTRRYNELKAAGQEHAPRALPAPTARDAVPTAAAAIIHREVMPDGRCWATGLAAP